MEFYNKEINCGKMYVSFNHRLEYPFLTLSVQMNEFGNCPAYKLVGDLITERLNSGEEISPFIKELKKYSCNNGNKGGCIEFIAECLEKHFNLNR